MNIRKVSNKVKTERELNNIQKSINKLVDTEKQRAFSNSWNKQLAEMFKIVEALRGWDDK